MDIEGAQKKIFKKKITPMDLEEPRKNLYKITPLDLGKAQKKSLRNPCF